MKIYYRGQKYDIRQVNYGGTLYFGVVRSDGKGIRSLFLKLDDAKTLWRKLESEVETK